MVIIPMAAILGVHTRKLGTHEKEVLLIMTLLSERKDSAAMKDRCRIERGRLRVSAAAICGLISG